MLHHQSEFILPGAPWLVAHRSMLGTNRPYKITLNSQDYVLWQNQQGEIFALDNICPHLQAPLSEGWICHERNTITCPFHALEFNAGGCLQNTDRASSQPLIEPLKLVVEGDYIWSYGKASPQLPIPDLLQTLPAGMTFIGVVGDRTVRAAFLPNLLINYDYNHLVGLHKDLFKVKANRVLSFTTEGYWAAVTQETERMQFSFSEALRDPVMLLMPKVYQSRLDYRFPAITAYRGLFPLGELLQVNIIYPETATTTHSFALVWVKYRSPLLHIIPKQILLDIINIGVEQDLTMVERCYPRQPTKIRLPNENIMDYAQQLYANWDASPHPQE
jgi:phenylpropionate dioxygenase-like ring-hydroxylating dioxygenase large terminal subunit